jgi:phytoene synthase
MSLIASGSARASCSLSQSREYCEWLTRSQARNFYYGLKLLPEPKRSAMFAMYSYMRLVDDIADGEDGNPTQQRAEALDVWAESTAIALAGQRPTDGHAIWPAFSDMVRRFNVPHQLFHEAIAGQRQDLEFPEITTFEQLKNYCYRVAGTVGVASIYVWGFEGGAETEALAVDRGIAFQLTNILRDLREDAGRGRVYLPTEELAAAGIHAAGITSAGENGGIEANDAFDKMMEFQIQRAEEYYKKSAALDSRISFDSRPTLMTMTRIYHDLLRKISNNPRRVLNQRVSLSTLSKIHIAWRATRGR